MNEPTTRLEVRPEVSSFVARVKERLSDLSDEEREELVGGLEADIAELVADGGSLSELGDPRAYADELRSAAGVERRPVDATAAATGFFRGRRSGRRLAERVDAVIDGSRRRWAELVDVPALRTSWDFLTTLRPVWWVLRAWVAVQLLDIFTQGGDLATPVPTLGGPVIGSLVWLVAIVVSVQIGRNRLWPGSGAARRTLARVVLLALNVFAVLMMPIVLGQFPASGTWADQGYFSYEPGPGLMNEGDLVQNVFPYDSDGNPLTGVQLFDQDGKPLEVARFAGDDFAGNKRTVTYPWLNGEQRLYNVFPLPRREQQQAYGGVMRDAWTSANPPYLPTPPLAVVPPAALPISPAPEAVEGAESGDADSEGSAKETSGTKSDEPADSSGASGRRDSEKATGR